MDLNSKTYNERLIYFATAKRATAKKVTQMVDGDFVEFWGGKLRGKFVSMDDEWKQDTKEEALNLARTFRKNCKQEAKEKGLL